MPMYQGGNKVSAAYANSGEEQCPAVVDGVEVYSCGTPPPDPFATAVYVMDMSGAGQTHQDLYWPHVNGFLYDCIIDWGDGTSTQIVPGDAWNSPKLFHDYGLTTGPGIYDVGISGTSQRLKFFDTTAFEYLINVKQWGKNGLINCEEMFDFCNDCSFTAAGPESDTSLVTTMKNMFKDCGIAEPDVSGFAMQNVTNVDFMWRSAPLANPNMGAWDMSSLVRMEDFMSTAHAMQGIGMGNWNTPNLARIARFAGNAFDQDIGGWDVTSLNDATDALTGAGPNWFSQANYDALLIGWGAQSVLPNVRMDVYQTYTNIPAVTDGRDALRNAPNNWNLTDDGIGP